MSSASISRTQAQAVKGVEAFGRLAVGESWAAARYSGLSWRMIFVTLNGLIARRL